MYKIRTFIGSKGFARTRLCPMGFVEIDGQLFDAVIRDGPKIKRGSTVEVIDTVCFSLVVKVLVEGSNN